jgi:hypothetical protein
VGKVAFWDIYLVEKNPIIEQTVLSFGPVSALCNFLGLLFPFPSIRSMSLQFAILTLDKETSSKSGFRETN